MDKIEALHRVFDRSIIEAIKKRRRGLTSQTCWKEYKSIKKQIQEHGLQAEVVQQARKEGLLGGLFLN